MTFTILLFDSGVCLPFDNSNANLKKFFIASNTELEKKIRFKPQKIKMSVNKLFPQNIEIKNQQDPVRSILLIFV